MKKIISTIVLLVLFTIQTFAVPNDSSTIVTMETNYGKIVLKLYPETAKHRANFLKLVNSGFYNGVLFHRVIADFMIQAGDPKSKTASANAMLGGGDVPYTIPAEIVYPKYYHKRGALAAARQGDDTNPRRASSGCQFYIVQGKVLSDGQIDAIENKEARKIEKVVFQKKIQTLQKEINLIKSQKNQLKLDEFQDSIRVEVRNEVKQDSSCRFTEERRRDYTTIGGMPHLDGEYTVFGEVVEGLDVVELISKMKTGNLDRPLDNVKIIKATVVN